MGDLLHLCLLMICTRIKLGMQVLTLIPEYHIGYSAWSTRVKSQRVFGK